MELSDFGFKESMIIDFMKGIYPEIHKKYGEVDPKFLVENFCDTHDIYKIPTANENFPVLYELLENIAIEVLKNSKMKLEDLDITPLERYISEMIGIPIIFKKTVKNSEYRGKYMELESREMIENSGIFRGGVESVKIKTFNNIKEVNTGTGMWGSISIRYKLKDGGSNSIHLCYCFYNIQNDAWSFRT